MLEYMRKTFKVLIVFFLGAGTISFAAQALGTTPKSAQISVVASCLKDENASLAVCEQAVSLKPKDYRLWNNLGTKVKNTEDQEAALTYFNKAILLAPSIPVVYYNRANTFVIMGQSAAALHDYDTALTLSPSSRLLYEIYISRGDLYLSSSSLQKAQQDFMMAQKLFPGNPKTYVFLGKYEDQQKHREAAIDYYTKAFALGNQDPRVYVNRGLSYTELHKFSEAEHDMNQAIKLAPDQAWGYYGMGIVYRDKGQPEKALDYFIKADRFPHKQFEIPYNIAIAFFRKNEFAKTLTYVNRAIKMNPSNADAYYMRGAAYTLLKQCPAANLDFKKACELGLSKACNESCGANDE